MSNSNAHINVFPLSFVFEMSQGYLSTLLEGLYIKSVRGFKLEQIRGKLNDFSESDEGSKH